MEKTLSKTELRKKALEKRKMLCSDTINSSVLNKLVNSDDFKNAKNVGLYFPIKNEIDITPILNYKDKNFYFPRCNGSDLEFCKYISKDSLVKGSFDIFEPSGEKIDPEILDVIYIPALMANKLCYRLGYGKGFYDRFFRQNKIRAKKILVLPSDLVNDEFKQDEFDVALDSILCEK